MNSLIELKTRNGSIDEFINLEYKILELDKEIQLLNNNAGKYDSSRSLCTVVISIREITSDTFNIILDSFYWALTASVVIIFIVIAVSGAGLLFFTLYEKLKKK